MYKDYIPTYNSMLDYGISFKGEIIIIAHIFLSSIAQNFESLEETRAKFKNRGGGSKLPHPLENNRFSHFLFYLFDNINWVISNYDLMYF